MPSLRPLPPWLGHALRAQRAPVPWPAVVRGALAAGPLLLTAVLAGRPSSGVLLALGAMLAGVNDRPGTRLSALTRLGGPALAGGVGMTLGTALHGGAVLVVAVFAGLGLVAGAFSAVGPVASACGTQLLVTVAIGAGMPLPEAGWQRGLLFVAGAGWLIALRVLLPSPRNRAPRAKGLGYLYDGERVAVAAVYDAVARLIEAAGRGDARARRAALTAALDQAQDALRGGGDAARRLRALYVAALPLAEAATALAWAGKTVPGRAAEGPRRLAVAVRTGEPVGPLPAPARCDAGLRALDEALLRAAEVFDGGRAPAPLRSGRTPADVLRKAAGPAGREYGVRVGLSFGASAAVAQALHPEHWYWLPATAVFLVKPDLGPLASRVLCRAAGTVAGAALFAGLAAVLPHPAGLVALVALCGALIPVATRHFAAQTAVVTVLVLSLVMVGGEPQASVSRITETLLACAIVLVAGHLPGPRAQRGGGVRVRIAVAREAAHQYVQHVLSGATGSEARVRRWALRREAYRTLAQARAAVDLAAAELPVVARHSVGARHVTVVLERLVDTTTACAVQVDDTGRVPEQHAERIGVLLAELAA
ncbi:FUSC family protein [Streptomyces sp. VRA16 Mangrove soil]|uniref:FUSC family protein n=1 Tax=Streptomyces sp. VRA16 Mangrove soil TaxID=2817434 RepID=UPI0027DC7AEE|nr:FUSC family protein [Streptomyces sp. VRA16 Mangrove soil]